MKRFLSVLGMKILQPNLVPRTQKAGVKGSMNQQGTLSSNPDYDSETETLTAPSSIWTTTTFTVRILAT
jgi:hypothetical protein